jgi:hypothetical protein
LGSRCARGSGCRGALTNRERPRALSDRGASPAGGARVRPPPGRPEFQSGERACPHLCEPTAPELRNATQPPYREPRPHPAPPACLLATFVRAPVTQRKYVPPDIQERYRPLGPGAPGRDRPRARVPAELARPPLPRHCPRTKSPWRADACHSRKMAKPFGSATKLRSAPFYVRGGPKTIVRTLAP